MQASQMHVIGLHVCYNTSGMLPIAVDIVARHDLCQAHFVRDLWITFAYHEFPDSTTVSVRAERDLYWLLLCVGVFPGCCKVLFTFAYEALLCEHV